MINFDPIEKNIIVGSTPHNRVDVARLSHMRITAILSLQTDADLKAHAINWRELKNAYEKTDITAFRFPITDFDEIELGQKLAEPIICLEKLVSQGRRVYVHCNAGICRAPATVLGYLCHFRGMSLEEGLIYLRERRPKVHPYLSSVKTALGELSTQ